MAGLAALPMLAKTLMVAKAIGTLAQGAAMKEGSRSVARQLESNANREEAAGQRAYLDEIRKGKYVESSVLAAAGASGAGVSDVTVENIRDDILDQSLYNAMTALYNGQSRARDMRFEGAVKREEGRQAMKGAIFEAVADAGTTAFSQGWFDPKVQDAPVDFSDFGDTFKPRNRKKNRRGADEAINWAAGQGY